MIYTDIHVPPAVEEVYGNIPRGPHITYYYSDQDGTTPGCSCCNPLTGDLTSSICVWSMVKALHIIYVNHPRWKKNMRE